MTCTNCGSENIRQVGTSCEEATPSMLHVDYFGDGSLFAPIGMHYEAIECLDCGEQDAEPCVHD